MLDTIVQLLYLSGVTCFILGLRGLSKPQSARNGNLLAALGMGLATIASLIAPVEAEGASLGLSYGLIAGGLVVGSAIGLVASKRVEMTAMPQLVSVFNGLGGACAVAISLVELLNYQALGMDQVQGGIFFTTLLTLFVGAVAFTGSLIAYGKLQGLINDRKVRLPQPTLINGILLLSLLGALAFMTQQMMLSMPLLWAFLTVSLIYGITFVLPIGGADMPVVISLLNAFTGIAASLAGLVYDNTVMLVGGILVGSSGTILTILMCQAMNRSLLNVIIGGFGSTGQAKAQDGDQVAKEITPYDAGILMRYARQVMIVPGYGMAVAQAQKVCHELEAILNEFGVEVKYAIHPVAGRMPGHMNVLLAEADVSYDKLLDLEDANSAFDQTDVVVIVGANDVVNPSALDDPGSAVYGMPILEVLRAKNVIVLKRSMRPGYAGIQNPLFFHEKNSMLFGDAKASLQNLVNEVKSMA